MIEVCSSNSTLVEFFSRYPDSVRKLCAEAGLLYGVRTIKNKFPYGLTANQLISVAGLPDSEDSHLPISSSCNISILQNKSLEVNRFLAESSLKSEEKTERFRESSKDRWTGSEKRPLKKIESEKKISFSSALKEPETCPYETAQKFGYKRDKPVREKYKVEGRSQEGGKHEFEQENHVMKIAEDFLKNSYAAYLATGGTRDRIV